MNIVKSLDSLNWDDIGRLLNNKVQESKTLDYKEELNLQGDGASKEFLFDLSSFANTEGGLIIFGIREKKDKDGKNTGLPEEIIGIKYANFEQIRSHMEDLAKNGLEPGINNLGIREIENDNKRVLVIRVPRRLLLPHMVTYRGTNKFYRRRNTGKYPVDVYELKNLFVEYDELNNNATSFVNFRFNEVSKGDFLPNLDLYGIFLLHVIPLGYQKDVLFDFTNTNDLNYLKTNLRPYRTDGWSKQFNLNGLLNFGKYSGNEIQSYVQCFRNGSLEYYTTLLHFIQNQDKNELSFSGGYMETLAITSVDEAINLYKRFSIEAPFAIFIMIHNPIDDKTIIDTGDNRMFNKSFISKKPLRLPPIVIENHDVDIERELKPIFDIFWQAVGYEKSPSYHESGDRFDHERVLS